jgi:hypothetical protein
MGLRIVHKQQYPKGAASGNTAEEAQLQPDLKRAKADEAPPNVPVTTEDNAGASTASGAPPSASVSSQQGEAMPSPATASDTTPAAPSIAPSPMAVDRDDLRNIHVETPLRLEEKKVRCVSEGAPAMYSRRCTTGNVQPMMYNLNRHTSTCW